MPHHDTTAGPAPALTPAAVQRIERLRDSLLDLDIVADDARCVVIAALGTYHQARDERDDIARQLNAALDEASR